MKVWVVYGRDTDWKEEYVWGVYWKREDAEKRMREVNEMEWKYAEMEEKEVK